MNKEYNKDNVFYKIITGQINADKIFEDDFVIAINDINPIAPVHILVISKKNYVDFTDFVKNASVEEIASYYQAIDLIAQKFALQEYRLVTNNGHDAGQSVFHFHSHIIGGIKMDTLINKGL